MPAIIFDRLPEDHVVQMFVTINAKHTRLNASHLVSLSGRQLYRDEALAAGARRRPRAERSRGLAALRRDQAARRRPRPRRAGAARAGAEEAVRRRRVRPGRKGDDVPRGVEEVLRQLLQADRAGVRRRVERPQVQHQSRRRRCARSSASRRTWSAGSIRSTPIAPTSAPSAASSRRGAAASATCGSRPKAPGSAAGTTVDSLAKELRLALQYPEGAAV